MAQNVVFALTTCRWFIVRKCLHWNHNLYLTYLHKILCLQTLALITRHVNPYVSTSLRAFEHLFECLLGFECLIKCLFEYCKEIELYCSMYYWVLLYLNISAFVLPDSEVWDRNMSQKSRKRKVDFVSPSKDESRDCADETPIQTEWTRCMFCHEVKTEKLVNPTESKQRSNCKQIFDRLE